MKTLYLVRHAKSSWDYPDLSDFDRPLSARGERDAPKMGQRLADKSILPGLIFSSPANRAFTTAQVIAKGIGYPLNKIRTQQSIYHASEGTLLKVVQNAECDVKSLMLFGHNPGFTDFACSLSNEDIYNIPTCGIVAIKLDISSWSEVNFGLGQLEFFDYPKKDQ
ncbi:SixA phosphatase family protein [Fulvivirga lutimaris]|uniref:SixA phosphatase family protein n=1 Tax=Fulvivirga lutimaris TaxID=1819566 RepID=UPI0012BD55F5|nr:histidine phosphatase family protein [Fulvivirga lutimaris]MTI40953.1 histidine phosphatase family protein [Fulvivirga lutimaris]